jgi:hypothetical protein
MEMAGACLPVILKQFTGQDLVSNSASSNNSETLLLQVLTLQQQIMASQQELTRRVINLETRASQQFTGLAQQVKNLGSIRLMHEKKQVDYNLQQELRSFDKGGEDNPNNKY